MNKQFAGLALGLIVTIAGLSAQAPSASDSDAMYNAIRANDAARISALLQGGFDVNTNERRGGATPLMHAAAFGSLDTMRLLIGKGADANARSAAKATALMWAGADAAKVRLLLDHGADVNAAADNGRTPLLLAAMGADSADAVKLLLGKGADPRALDSLKTTAVWAATYGNDTETIRLIVAAGADVNAADALRGLTPLMNAASNGNVEAIKLLLAKGADPNAVSGPPGAQVKNGTINLGGFTPLTLAATESADAVKALIDGGALPTINIAEARGMTPLAVAASSDHADPETIKLLLARGADPGKPSAVGETALDWARKSGETRATAMLKAAKAPAGAAPLASPAVPPAAPVPHREALDRSIGLIERASGTFFTNGACGACHSQNITDLATMAARKRGVRISDQGAAQRMNGTSAAFAATASRLLLREDTPVVDIPAYTLAGLAAGAAPADRATDVLVHNIAAQQLPDGHWHVGGIPRPPIEDGDFTRTALGVRALTVYAMPGRGAELRDRATRAVDWLRRATPVTAEDRSFRLLGLKWGGADRATVSQAARVLSDAQRPDGGWSQRSEMNSDAYATGLAMYALLESDSLTPSTATIRRGTEYLLSTQRGDGSWHVRSRAPKFQPYFDGGFPYGPDQWISAMATGWATAALALSLDEGATRIAGR